MRIEQDDEILILPNVAGCSEDWEKEKVESKS